MTFVIADSDNAGQGQQNQEQEQNQEMNEDAGATQTQTQTRARNLTELKQMIQERKELQQQELAQMKQKEKNVYQNQNRVRLAVHALLAMENLTGIGKNVSAIAREFNNSAQATIRHEERMQMRNALTRFFAGGDEATAEEMEQEVTRNRERTQNLRQLYKECDCDEEVKAMMQEQIQNMEQEQTRLQELATKEKKSKGLFGWLWK